MSSPAEALAGIRDFVAGVRLDPSGADFESQSARRIYRRFHALLIWEMVVDREGQNPSVRLYLRETLSDLSTAYFLNFSGVYKASRLSARGSLENIIRVLAASAGCDVLSLNTVPSLVSACREHWGDVPQKVQCLTSLYVLYGELCNTVHSVAVDYMSLRIPFEKVIEQDETAYTSNVTLLDTLFRLVGEALFLTYHSYLGSVDFRNADYVRDSIANDIKRSVIETPETKA